LNCFSSADLLNIKIEICSKKLNNNVSLSFQSVFFSELEFDFRIFSSISFNLILRKFSLETAFVNVWVLLLDFCSFNVSQMNITDRRKIILVKRFIIMLISYSIAASPSVVFFGHALFFCFSFCWLFFCWL